MQGSDPIFGDLDPARVPNPPPQPTSAAPTPDAEDRIVLTREQFDEIMRQNAEEAARNREILAAVLNPPTPVVADTLPDVQIDINGLPDPAMDRDGFLRGLGERLSGTVKQIDERARAAATSQVSQAQSAASLIDEAWGQMQAAHPELAEHPALVDALSRRWADQQRAAGRDPIAMLQRDFEGTTRSVGDFVMGELGPLLPAAKEPAEDHRTGGIPSTRARGPARPAGPPPGTLVDDLKDFQSRARIY